MIRSCSGFSFQNTADRCAADLELSCDCGFADAGTEESVDMLRAQCGCWRPSEARLWVAQTMATRIQALVEADLAADDTVGEPWLAEL